MALAAYLARIRTMKAFAFSPSRRRFLHGLALGAAAFTTPGLFAEELARTPRQTAGPGYPDKLPLDTDNDLLILNDGLTPAVGEVTHLTGRVLGSDGKPVRNAVVEIWQVDSKGAYLHSGSANRTAKDANFQGFGRFLTSASGEYYFRTIKPVPYPGRTPHIHFIVKKGDKRMLTTQLYVKGEPGNDRDFIYRGIGDQKARDLLTADFAPIKDSKIGELSAKFDIVLGTTPEEAEDGRFGAGRGKRPGSAAKRPSPKGK
jgi:protocatechuate 3,4-dioxygenase beta subunit